AGGSTARANGAEPPAAGAVAQPVSVDALSGVRRELTLGPNKSLVIDLPRDARDILGSNPYIADAVIRTSRRIYLMGRKAGQTNIMIFDRAGGTIANLDVSV